VTLIDGRGRALSEAHGQAQPEGNGLSFEEIAWGRVKETAAVARCRREIAAIEVQIRAGHPDLLGLCLGLKDWSLELKFLLATKTKEAAEAEPRRRLGTQSEGVRL
jgi:hypothetical protein